MKGEKVLWWIFFVIFVAFLIFGTLIFTATIIANPVAATFFLGLTGFWLFANRLIFGFAGITNTANQVAKGEEVDREKLASYSKEPEERTRDLSLVSLLILWRNALEPYRYAYYFAFFIVFIIAMLFQLNIIQSYVGVIAKSIMFGASVPTLIVWVLDIFSRAYLSGAIKASMEA